VEEALIDFGSDHSFDQAAIKFKRHYKFAVSDATIRRTTESMGKKAQNFIHTKLEKFEKDDSQNIVSNKPLEKVFLGVDGASVRTGQLEPIIDQNSSDPLKTPSGRVKCKRKEEWKDVRLAYSKGDTEDSAKFFIGGIKSFPTLTRELFALSLGLGMNEDTKPIATCDGGNGLFEQLDIHFCDLQFILDYYHFKGHLYKAAEKIGLSDEAKHIWVKEREDLIWEKGPNGLLEKLELDYKLLEEDRLRQLIDHLTRFKDCIDYKSFKELGYPIGSGEIESSHKYITQQRLKLSGACWKIENVTPMLSLRLIKNNGWWDEFWSFNSGLKAA
jgi:hypothetical protein